ncbi:hypothetical protein GGS24DRAFT_465042 [Hypoxylon argillaceum]|nr:hypothetical protein GGS24DRAFT_465042 [Hypoxylon argillaceum]
MLRGPATPSRLEAEAETHHPFRPHARHLEVYEPPTLTFEPLEGLSLKHNTNLVAESRSTASNYRQHQRQQSAPSFSTRRSNAPSLPPSRPHTPNSSLGMPLTGDRGGGNSPGRFGGRLSGRSTPVEYDTSSLSQHTRTAVDTTPKSAAQSRLGFLASSVSAFTSRMTSPTQAPARTDDELCDLDIEAALFPPSSPLSPLDSSSSDAFSPAAYKNLQANATGLLHRMQDACRRRTAALAELRAEREAREEEMEEMELRTRNFKSQLEAMAAKAAAQEEAMAQLVAELQAERKRAAHFHPRHHDEHPRHEKMFRVGGVEEEEEEEAGHEDLCVDEDERRKRWRASNGTVKSDASVDTSDGSVAESESIFSRSRSPTAMTCLTESESLDVPPPTPTPSLRPRTAARPKSGAPQQLTAFQRLVKGISAAPGGGGESQGGVDACRNCRGQDSSVAWNTVSLLRDENSGLKQRVAHLEVAVEGALDVVYGIKI